MTRAVRSERQLGTSPDREEPIHVVYYPNGFKLYEIPDGTPITRVMKFMKTEAPNPHDPSAQRQRLMIK